MTQPMSRHARGFTVVELIITIGLIVLLVGLTVAVTSAFSRKSEVGQTEDMIRLLDMAVLEWEQAAERPLTLGDPGTGFTFDIDETEEPAVQASQLVTRIGNTAGVREILAQIDTNFLQRDVTDIDGDGDVDEKIIRDAWDNLVYVIHPGRIANAAPPFNDVLADADQDRTIRTMWEDEYGVALNVRLFFVSAGPDGRFGLDGDFSGLTGAELDRAKREARADNVYSYEVETP